MRSRIVLGVCMGALWTGSLSADTRFTGAVSQLWSNSANWTAGLPDQDDKIQVVDGGFCILDYDAGTIKQTAIEGGGAGHLRLVEGAKLAVRDWSIIGYAGAPEEPHQLEVLGGVYNANARMFIGFLGRGLLVVDYAGVVNLNAQELGLGEDAGGDGRVEVRGGSLNLLSTSALPLRFRAGANSKASMDFRGGVMTQAFSQARANFINTNTANGTITAYGGAGTVIVETIDGQLIVKGLHPLKPVPGDGDSITAGDLTLSWTVGAGTPVDVWFGTSADLGAAELIVKKQAVTSVAVKVNPKQRYYWAVDRYVPGATDPNWGPIFDFYVDNLAPKVEAGLDVPTWLTNGSVAVALAGTVTDADPTTSLWTVSAFDPNDPSDPNELIPAADFPGPIPAVIANADRTAATVTLSALGTYQLKLAANDGEYTGSDTLLIKVFRNHCEAAKSLPGYVPIPGDINGDCIVNDLDLAILQANWLKCNGLDCPDPNKP
jgi:hypothetical protein